MSVPDRVETPGTASRRTGDGWLVWMAVGVALAFVIWTAGSLAALPPLPARSQADAITGTVSLLTDLTARLAAFATLGSLFAVVALIAPGPDHTLPNPLAAWPAGQDARRRSGSWPRC